MFGFNYTWVKILETMKKRSQPVRFGELRADLSARGFHVQDEELTEDLNRMRGLGLIDVDLLVTPGGDITAVMDEDTRIGVAPTGARRTPARVKA